MVLLLATEAPRDPHERARRTATRRAHLKVLAYLEEQASRASVRRDYAEVARLDALISGIHTMLRQGGAVDPDGETAGYTGAGCAAEPGEWWEDGAA